MGKFNTKIGREGVFNPVIESWSLHETSNENGIREVVFATNNNNNNNMIIKRTHFPHRNVNKETWQSSDGRTNNQTDHILACGRHASGIMGVRNCRGAHCNLDHHLVQIKYRQNIAVQKFTRCKTKEV